MAINMFEGARRIAKLIAVFIVAGSLSSCGDDHVFTLYSTNFPDDSGRHPVATFDVASTSEANLAICQEAAELYQTDFERRKAVMATSGFPPNAKARHWCEKGRHKP